MRTFLLVAFAVVALATDCVLYSTISSGTGTNVCVSTTNL